MSNEAGWAGPTAFGLLWFGLGIPVYARYIDAAFVSPDTAVAGVALLASGFWARALMRTNRYPAGDEGVAATVNRPGFALWLPALAGGACVLFGHAIEIFFAVVVGLWLLAQAGVACFVDPVTCARLWPVRVFSFFAVPVPQSLVVGLTGGLKSTVAAWCGAVLAGIGLPLTVAGNRIITTHGIVEVAPACSGFRSLVVVGVLAVGVALHRRLGPGRFVVLATAGAVAAVVTNVVRVAAVAVWLQMTAVAVPDAVHTAVGLLFDAFAMYFVVLLGKLLFLAPGHASMAQTGTP